MTTGDRVTDLIFISQRTTLYGAERWVNIDTKNRLAAEEKAVTASGSVSSIQATADPLFLAAMLSYSHLLRHVDR